MGKGDEMINSIEQARRANERAGLCWFSKDTMRYFRCRLSERVYPVSDGMLFVASNRTYNDGRDYQVVFIADAGNTAPVDEASDYPDSSRYATSYAAHRAAKIRQANWRGEEIESDITDARNAWIEKGRP